MTDGRPKVVIIGPPGAGKTKVGKRVARRLEVGFVDTDHRIVAKHGPIADIFAQHGESRFREWERTEVAEALRSSGVVSLGGGAVLDPRTQADLEALPVALITVSADAVEARISGSKRPLLAAGGVAAWRTLVEQRMPLYESLATRRFDSSSTPMDTVAARVVAWLLEETR
ncbi:shikimate kinase [Herbiconiux sp. L3-i23]|uniref:shikimate kinase n=1 Tax=Herbiconiux sp. L3-i23 TaxID=2905871 RepID=UPI00204C1CAE|nr:shikimate kinase [Herbiconiux sp. L3-i23]BDI22793.1 shikimate kinase [Herbiconiux sp. L3-i23]